MPPLKILPLPPEVLRPSFDSRKFRFKTTEDLPPFFGFVGQDRALRAAAFGIGIPRHGFNVFALGPSGVGKRSIIRALLEKESEKKPAPPDICYVHNFHDPREPKLLLLKPGLGRKLADDMRQLIDILRVSIPAIFDSKAYTTRIKEIQEEALRRQEKEFSTLEKEASENQVAILRTPDGLMLAATRKGEIIPDDEFQKLPPEEREQKEAVMRKLHKLLMAYLEQLPKEQKEQREKIKEALKDFTMQQVGSVINDVRNKYKDEDQIVDYLNKVQQAILDNPIDFRKTKEGLSSVFSASLEEMAFNRYRINVLVDNSIQTGAPIIFEDNPSFSNLVGRVDHVSQFGALVTDFTLIRAGAMHKANGGFLLIDAIKLFSQPFAWDALKRALRAKIIRVENIQQAIGFMGTISIEPEPVALDLKVVMFGDRYVYYLLCVIDPEFLELFKVAADFDEYINRNAENSMAFAQLMKNLAQKDQLKPLHKEAVAEMLDHSSRLSGDAQKISTHVQKLADLLREADHYASLNNQELIDRPQIEKAIAEQKYRASRLKEEQYEHISRGTVLLDTKGEKIGQINGLSYIQLGGFSFGYPMRITARVGYGTGDLLDIEREVKLGGPIHSKGILILAGYLRGQFAKQKPLTLSASLVVEQSYGGVEGDSASLAEACVLLSAIAEIPLSQSLGITGSINQHGQVQPIGGVNEKIEGFFDVCQEKGFSKPQGVVIPQRNVSMLMLRKDVLDAAKSGDFHVYAVDTVDEAMEILTGVEAGARNDKGKFPKESINGKVEEALEQLAKTSIKRAQETSKKTRNT